jgi:cytidine deaminase
MDRADRALLAAAKAALAHAHAPYSGFRVGAALRTSDGRVHVGVNVENASFGLTLCAERVAAATAIAAGQRDFASLAIASSSGRATPPCGACRQFLFEFAPSLRVLLDDGGETPPQFELSQLLPMAFVDFRTGPPR